MESKPTEQAKKENAGCGEASQVAACCLAVPLILRKIQEQLSNADLLSLSLVNKLWNYEARSVMKKRDSLTASLKFSTHSSSCQSLTNFASHLNQMNVVPFSGISFLLRPGESHECEPPSREEPLLDSSHKTILSSLRWKHLSITSSGLCKKCRRFPRFLSLVKAILKEKCGVLEELCLNLDSKMRGEFIQECLQGCRFPNLRMLKLGQLQEYRPSVDDTEFIKALLSLTPKLQELRIPDWCVDIQEDVLRDTSSSPVILTNCLLMNYLCPYRYCFDGILDVVRFERMTLCSWESHFNPTIFDYVIPNMLRRSRTTLRSLCLHAALAVPLMLYGISLDNVRKLTISMDFNSFEPGVMIQVMTLLKTFDFTRTFPHLDRVITGDFHCGSPSDYQVYELIELGNGLWKEPSANRAVKIKHLSVSKTVDESLAPFLAEILPDIQILSVDPVDTYIPFEIIWEHWADLKELHVRSYHMERGGPVFINGDWRGGIMPNLDSDFCGIFPEEVAQLIKEDEEYLRKVHIVPIKPAIGCLKNLRTFTCYLQPSCLPVYEGIYDPPVLSITQVTGLIAFSRCPNLIVTLQTVSVRDAEALRHMEPYASVVPVGLDIWPWNDMSSDHVA